MALTVRTLTVATTVEDVEASVPGGMATLRDQHRDVVTVGQLVRLPAALPGLRCGIWSARRGVYAAEMVAHPDIRLLAGRRLKSAGLIHRSVRLRDEPPPLPPPPPQPALIPLEPDPPATRLSDSLHLAGSRLPGVVDARFEVGGDGNPARAFRIALWLALRKGIPVADLQLRHLDLLPKDRFEVDATALGWELRYRFGAMASGLGSSAQYGRVQIMREVAEVLASKGLIREFGQYRWPAELFPEGRL